MVLLFEAALRHMRRAARLARGRARRRGQPRAESRRRHRRRAAGHAGSFARAGAVPAALRRLHLRRRSPDSRPAGPRTRSRCARLSGCSRPSRTRSRKPWPSCRARRRNRRRNSGPQSPFAPTLPLPATRSKRRCASWRRVWRRTRSSRPRPPPSDWATRSMRPTPRPRRASTRSRARVWRRSSERCTALAAKSNAKLAAALAASGSANARTARTAAPNSETSCLPRPRSRSA